MPYLAVQSLILRPDLCDKDSLLITGGTRLPASLKIRGTVRVVTVRVGTVRVGTVRVGTVRVGRVRVGTVRVGMVRVGTVRVGMVTELTNHA